MIRKLLTLVLAVAVIVSLVIVGCAKPAPAPAPTPTPAPPSGPEEIRVGATASLTGMFAGFGEGHDFGERAAVEDINKQGGVYVKEYGRKLPIKLITVNTESDPLRAGTLAEDLILREKVDILVSGNEPPPMHNTIATVAARYKIPHLAHAAVLEPWLGMRADSGTNWPYTWAFGFAIATPAPPGDFRAVPGYTVLDTCLDMLDMYGDQTNKRVGVYSTDEPDGRAWYALFPPAIEGMGFDVYGEEKELGLFPVGITDFTPLIQEWKNYDCDIVYGNCPAPDFATMWRQCHLMGFQPKIVYAGRAAASYIDVSSWGGNLPLGIGQELLWDDSYDPAMCPGIGDTTGKTLLERWTAESGQPLNRSIGLGYYVMQVLFDSIERAGTLDKDAINKAIGETDLMTINYRVKFDENQFNVFWLSFGQWHTTDTPWVWELPVVLSKHDWVKVTAEPIFPIPYD